MNKENIEEKEIEIIEEKNINTKDNFDDKPFIENDHHGLKVFIVIAIIFLLIGGGIIYFYFKIYNNPMFVIGNILNNTKESINNIKKLNDIKKLKLTGALDFDLDFENQEYQKIANIINDINLQYSQSIDLNNNYSTVGFYTKYKDKKLLNIKGILELDKQTGYIYFDDLYDKYLKTDLKTTTDTNIDEENVENINTNTIIDSIYKAFEKAIKKDDFKREQTTININGEKTKVYCNSLIIDHNNYQRIMTTITKELLNNKEFIKEMNKINENNDTEKQLNETLTEIQNSTFENIIEINFYTKANLKQDLVKIEIKETNKETIYNIIITQTNEYETTITFKENDNELGIITLKNTNANNISIIFDFKLHEDIIKISLNLTYEEINNLGKIDTTNYIEIENFNNIEQQKFAENLSKNEALIELINDINTIFSLKM